MPMHHLSYTGISCKCKELLRKKLQFAMLVSQNRLEGVVPGEGLEPSRLASAVFETAASTIPPPRLEAPRLP
jgi:hypothetical protein